jgi:hypothetical protein
MASPTGDGPDAGGGRAWRQVALVLSIGACAGLAAAALLLARDEGDERRPAPATATAPLRLTEVAAEAGLDFHHGAFRTAAPPEAQAMLGGGLCWIDVDGDGWLDLYAVDSTTDLERATGNLPGPPRNRLYLNDGGRFVDVSRGSGADLAMRGNGCVAADLDRDGDSDLLVTAVGPSALLWNDGDGTFTEGAADADAGLDGSGWYAGAAVGDVNGDGWPDVFLAGYVDMNAPIPSATQGFPNTYQGVRDLLFLSDGATGDGHPTFREVGIEAGIEAAGFEYGLGAVLSDFDRDGDLDLYVANDTNPNRLYENVPWPGGAEADPYGLGFRLGERAASAGVADPNAGMGIAAQDYDGNGRPDIVVTNARDQGHGVFRGQTLDLAAPAFFDARADFDDAFDASFTGFGASWADFDLDADLDLLLANGAIPVLRPRRDAEPMQLFQNGAAQGDATSFVDASREVGLLRATPRIGRGLALADYDNDGDVDAAVGSIGGPIALLRNDVRGGSWLEVSLDPPVPGAEVTVVLPDGRELRRVSLAGSSYLSSEDPRVHFGLGGAETVREVVVRLPGRDEQRLGAIEANRLVTVEVER